MEDGGASIEAQRIKTADGDEDDVDDEVDNNDD